MTLALYFRIVLSVTLVHLPGVSALLFQYPSTSKQLISGRNFHTKGILCVPAFSYKLWTSHMAQGKYEKAFPCFFK